MHFFCATAIQRTEAVAPHPSAAVSSEAPPRPYPSDDAASALLLRTLILQNIKIFLISIEI